MTLPNWFEVTAEKHFLRFLPQLNPRRCLQLGAFTGDASVWILEHFPDCKLVDVDTWEGSGAEHEAISMKEAEHLYDDRMGKYGERVHKWKGTTADFLAYNSPWLNSRYDFVYVDADHHASSVLADAVGAWALLRPGGLMAFDDYLWAAPSGRELDTPFPGIEAFRHVYADQLEVLLRAEQCWVRKR